MAVVKFLYREENGETSYHLEREGGLVLAEDLVTPPLDDEEGKRLLSELAAVLFLILEACVV